MSKRTIFDMGANDHKYQAPIVVIEPQPIKEWDLEPYLFPTFIGYLKWWCEFHSSFPWSNYPPK